MKENKNQPNFPSTLKAGTYIFLVPVISLFCWYLLTASYPEDNEASIPGARLAIDLFEERMISISEDSVTENPESEIKLESWMITQEDLKDNNEYISFTNLTLHCMNLRKINY
jgi:hypothetical protein